VEVHSDDRMPEYPERDFSSWPVSDISRSSWQVRFGVKT
jgi:hypothetical protein